MKLPTGCAGLDKLLKGGVESGILTQIYGEAASGKTTLCLQLACNCVNEKKKVAYIDTEGVSMERLLQIGGPDLKVDYVLIFRPYSLEEQEKMVKGAVKLQGIGLVVVDTINMFLRMRYHEEPETCDAMTLRQLETLYIAAHKHDYPVVVTSQVYAKKETGEILPFGGRDLGYVAKTIIKLEKLGIGKRNAILMKHRHTAEGESTEFRLTERGLE